MLPRVDVVIPDQRRPLATSGLWSALRGADGAETEEKMEEEGKLSLHVPTTQELLQYELVQLALDANYKPKHPKAWRTREFVLLAVARNGRALQYASKALRNDKGVVMAAVTQNGDALQYASEALQGNKDIVMAAVKQSGRALVYSSLSQDKEVVVAAIKQDVLAAEFAAPELNDDKEVVMAVLKHEPWRLRYSKFQNDKDFVMAAAMQDKRVLEYVSPELREAIQNDAAERSLY